MKAPPIVTPGLLFVLDRATSRRSRCGAPGLGLVDPDSTAVISQEDRRESGRAPCSSGGDLISPCLFMWVGYRGGL